MYSYKCGTILDFLFNVKKAIATTQQYIKGNLRHSNVRQ